MKQMQYIQYIQAQELLKAHTCLLTLSATCRILLSFSDGTLMLASGPRLLWAQDQGLAAIQQALFIDLPAPSRELAAAIRESAPTLKDRLNIEFIALKVRPCLSPACLPDGQAS